MIHLLRLAISLFNTAVFLILAISLPNLAALELNASTDQATALWPSVIDETTGRRVYQLTNRPGHNMAFYYLFKNQGKVDGVPYLAYRNLDSSGISYYSINLETGKDIELTDRSMVGPIADVVGKYLYCMKKEDRTDSFYSYIIRSNLKTGAEERILELDTAYKHSANLTVSSDGSKILFMRPIDNGGIDLMCCEVKEAKQQKIASGKMSHLQFGPVDPNLYIYIDQNYGRNWKRVGLGYIDLNKEHIANSSIDASDQFFDQSNGRLTPSHLHWDSDGNPAITAVDTSKPYVNEYNVIVIPNKKKIGKVLNYKKAQIKMGQFQTHFNAGAKLNEYVGDGESADWWHKPGFGKPYIHKIIYDYNKETMRQIPLAAAIGTYWKAGPLEPNARYVPGSDLVVWNAFMTLDGETPNFLTEEQLKSGQWEERSEQPYLYGSTNKIMQNVFAVFYEKEDQSGWDFTANVEGWQAERGLSLSWYDGGLDDASIQGNVSDSESELISPDNIALSCDSYNGLIIRLKNQSAASHCKVYFTTTSNPRFSEDKSAISKILPHFEDFQSIFLDLSSNSKWTGDLKRFKILPAADTDAGSYTIQFIRLVSASLVDYSG